MANYNNINENINAALEEAYVRGNNEGMQYALFWVCRKSGHSPKEYANYPDWGSTFEAALEDLLNK